MTNQLLVTLEGSQTGDDGVSVGALVVALSGIQDAMRLMVGHLGGHQQGRGRPPKWVIEQSNLRMTTTRSGSFVAELAPEQPPGGRPRPEEGYGQRAIAALHDWDGSEDSTLPKAVVDKLLAIPSELPKGQRIWLGTVDSPAGSRSSGYTEPQGMRREAKK